MSSDKRKGRLYYHRLPEFWRKENKLDFLSDKSLNSVDWQRLIPNTKHTWRRTDTEDEFDAFIPIGSKEAKRAKPDQAQTLFKIYSLGVSTNRDMYVYDFEENKLRTRMSTFVDSYNSEVDRYRRSKKSMSLDEFVNYDLLKWDNGLKRRLKSLRYGSFDSTFIRTSLYRPFAKRNLYFDRLFIFTAGQHPSFFPNVRSETENMTIVCSEIGYRANAVSALLTNTIPDLHLCASVDGHQCFPFYTYDEDGSNRRENITDYALDQFRSHYNDPAISKWDIFYYVYGLLHHPGYRQRYAVDLKRNLPRIPFAPVATKSPPIAMEGDLQAGGFWAFSKAGKKLAELHLNYESVKRYELDWESTRTPDDYRVEKMLPKGKVDSSEGNYKVYETLKYNDTLTLHGIPERAFAYRLGNRSALDWIVDQYRVKTDKRSGITHDPNGYSDDPQYILKLIERVITVSLRTVDIVEELAKLPFRPEFTE